MKEINLEFIFLPPYSPDLASVEFYFRDLKSIMKKNNNSWNINFNYENGRKKIYEALAEIDKTILLNWWKEFIENDKHSIIELYW